MGGWRHTATMVMVMVVMVLVVKVRDILPGHYGNVPMVQVRFETGPGGAQSVEVRVTDSATEAGADTLLTSGDSSEVPGVITAANETSRNFSARRRPLLGPSLFETAY